MTLGFVSIRLWRAALLGSAVCVGACSPNVPAEPSKARRDVPSDLLKTQRQALEQARAVEGVLRKQADDQRRTIDNASQ